MIEEDPDNWWTPHPLYVEWCNKYRIYPELDVCADEYNKKCEYYIGKESNALNCDWVVQVSYNLKEECDIWCNAPGKYIQQMVDKAEEQWRKHNMNIMMLIPVNTLTNDGFEKIWDLFMADGSVEIWPQFGLRPKFLDGRKDPTNAKIPNWGSRNGYIILIFRKK